MPPNIKTRNVLDEGKRQQVISLLTNGSSRRVAARFVGCAPSTIARTAARCPEFAQELVRAEQVAEVDLLSRVRIAARHEAHWRAAAWLLERRNPEDFAARQANLFTAEQVREILGEIVEILRDDLPEENCRRALERLDDLILEFKVADATVIVEPSEGEGGRLLASVELVTPSGYLPPEAARRGDVQQGGAQPGDRQQSVPPAAEDR